MAMKQLVVGILTSLVTIGTAQAQSVDDYYAELKEWVYGPCIEVGAALGVRGLDRAAREQGVKRQHVARFKLTRLEQDIRAAAETLASGKGSPDWEARRDSYPSPLISCIKEELSYYGAVPAGDTSFAWPVESVLYANIVKVDAAWDMPPRLAPLVVRLRDVNTPKWDSRAKCPEEREAGKGAMAFTTDAIAAAKEVVVSSPAWGEFRRDEPWRGLVVADLMLDGKSLAEMLIEVGHGKPPNRTPGWCSG